ncbi:Tc5 transposase DNA-binding domain [Popillia japonica]|uniref:Tc5 transposase DNA-binding domain n=1 Tax=Popillia japonica TaxID=7064 RepID=A0AAW1K3K8_POPJA
MGPESILQKNEEDLLVDWIVTVAKVGFPITNPELLDSVQHLIQELQHENPCSGNRPDKTWFRAFLKHHPNIGVRIAQNLTASRAAVRKETLMGWYEEIENYLRQNNYYEVLEDLHSVFNADESAFFLNPKGNHFLTLKGEKTVYQQLNCDEKECLTVLITGNAAEG